MCGINLIIDKKTKLSSEVILKMEKALHHRGPDHSAFSILSYPHSTYYLSNNRLKIRDISEQANQPFRSNCARYHLIFNGEITNYHVLKNELKQDGFTFRTSSDTEVLLNMLIYKGAEAIAQLDGMFAFIFFDQQEEKLILARDRHGIKPLFYSHQADYFLASSEIKGILASELVPKKLNDEQVRHYLKFRYARKPQTFFQNIYELEEGYYMSFQKGAMCKHECFTDKNYLSGLNHSFNEKSVLTKTEGLLHRSVNAHYEGTGQKSLFLSGGVDSTLLLALFQENNLPVQPFAIVHDKKESNFGTQDTYYARKAAKTYHTKLEEVFIESSMLKSFEDFATRLDQPIGDSGAFLTYLISEKAAYQHKIAFSGAGADEWFGGYNRHQAFYTYLHNYQLFSLAQPLLKTGSKLLPTGFEHPFRKHFQLLKKLGNSIDKNPQATFYNFQSFMPLSETNELEWPEKISTSFIDKHFHAALSVDKQNYLISDVLAISDQMSMQHGLELRVPYLDNQLTEFIGSLPTHLLMKNGPKWILKAILKKYKGEEFISRAKEGFGAPFGHWIRKPENRFLFDYLNKKERLIFKYIGFDYVQRLIDEHMRLKADHTLILWNLLTLSVWLERF